MNIDASRPKDIKFDKKERKSERTTYAQNTFAIEFYMQKRFEDIYYKIWYYTTHPRQYCIIKSQSVKWRMERRKRETRETNQKPFTWNIKLACVCLWSHHLWGLVIKGLNGRILCFPDINTSPIDIEQC